MKKVDLKRRALIGAGIIYAAAELGGQLLFRQSPTISLINSLVGLSRPSPLVKQVTVSKHYAYPNYEIWIDAEVENPGSVGEANAVVQFPDYSLGTVPMAREGSKFVGRFLTQKVGGHVGQVVLNQDQSSMPFSVDVAINQAERESSANQGLLDRAFERILYEQEYFKNVDREALYQQAHPFLKNKSSLQDRTIDALSYYNFTYFLGYPRSADADVEDFLIAPAEASADLYDFTVRTVTDVTGQEFVLGCDKPREAWSILDFLKQRPYVVGQVKKHRWVNAMIKQIAWGMFDSPYKPEYFDFIPYYPYSKRVRDVTLNFFDYFEELPARMQADGLPVFFPYFDSDMLRSQMADETDVEFALRYLADIPHSTVDFHDSKIVDVTVYRGMAGKELFVEQLPERYGDIANNYPDMQVYAWERFRDVRDIYYDWLVDRYGNELRNTVVQFLGGWDWSKVQQNDFGWIADLDGIDQYLAKNWPPWDLARFIYGYCRYRWGEWSRDYPYDIPASYKSLGIPYSVSGDFRNYLGASGYEWGVYGIPDSVINPVKENGKFADSYGNGAGLLFCVDGIEKDLELGPNGGLEEARVYQRLGFDYNFWPPNGEGRVIYLWVKS
ncbi:MAG: hypothetical protein ACUVWK_06405 [Nitrososphaerales archaeon]